MRYVNIVSNLLFPPRCVNCGELLYIDITEKQKKSLCEKCRAFLESEKVRSCPECGVDMKNCRCMPKALSKAGCSALLKLVSYRPYGNMPIRKMIFSLKHSYNKPSFEFVAEQLRFLLISEMKKRKLMPCDCVISYLPRSSKNKNEEGFDQACEIAKALSRQTGIKLSKCLRRRFFTREEKKLNRVERLLNMDSAFCLDGKSGDVEGKTVILVDDIVTTGSGMAAASKLVLSAGAYDIIGLCVGYTDKNDKK